MKSTLQKLDYDFDPQLHLVWKSWNVTGSESRQERGPRAHPIRESVDYALELLTSKDEDCIERACLIINRVIGLQEQDPLSDAYGLWPRYLEEPLRLVESPDRSWADVIGYRFCKILWRHKLKLPSETIDALKLAIGYAATSISNRGNSADKVKFVLISVIVVMAGAELLADRALAQYGRERLSQIVRQTQRGGEFGEYNSPYLTLLALEECDVLIEIIRDEITAQYAQHLRYIAWRSVAEHYHPGTQQWAGPHGWSDQDLLEPDHIKSLLTRNLGCPPDLRSRIDKLPTDESVVRHLYVHPSNPNGNVAATTLLTEDLCLGTSDEESLWQRRRPLIGYWKSGGGGVAVLRARFLHDGRDFASGVIRNVQEGPRVLSNFSISRSSGDLHPYVDRPNNGAFRGSDFRVRYQLTADDAAIADIGEGKFMMTSGDLTAVVHTLPGFFHKFEVRWAFGRDGNTVFVDAICYTGEPRIIRAGNVRTVLLAAGLEILREDDLISPEPELLRAPQQHFLIKWDDMQLNFSSRPRD